MPAFFDNKAIFPEPNEILEAVVVVHAQPSTTSIYIDGIRKDQSEGNVQYQLGTGAVLKGKKIRIHTSVQDKNDNTDDIKVKHQIMAGSITIMNRDVNTTAAEEGDIFDIFTDIMVF